MGFSIKDREASKQIERNIQKAQNEAADALSRLSSGNIFEGQQTEEPARRAMADRMNMRMRSLSESKKNVNDSISMLQTADSALSEIGHIVTRMKELHYTAANGTVSDPERKYLFIEYQALHEEINRIAHTTEFNGIPLLRGDEETPSELYFRIDDPHITAAFSGEDEDLNLVKLSDLRSLKSSAKDLGLNSASKLLSEHMDDEGVPLEEVMELMQPDSDHEDHYATVYDQAVATLADHRTTFGSIENRLQRALDYMDVYEENIAAAHSKISDTDYAAETSRLVQAKLLMNAGTALLAQSERQSQEVVHLLQSVL